MSAVCSVSGRRRARVSAHWSELCSKLGEMPVQKIPILHLLIGKGELICGHELYNKNLTDSTRAKGIQFQEHDPNSWPKPSLAKFITPAATLNFVSIPA
uniref:Uncharacterized protein n=1 Tax=Glossina brevipalpis TaxID=37001 RepID=A0A1A9WK46_9MUSC